MARETTTYKGAAVSVPPGTDFYRVPWPVWRDMAEIYGRKYMTHAELSRYEVPATAGFIKFLHGIESETLGKEDAHDPTP